MMRAIRVEEFMITFKMEENTAFFQPDLDRAVMSMNIANQRGSRGRIFRLKGDAEEAEGCQRDLDRDSLATCRKITHAGCASWASLQST